MSKRDFQKRRCYRFGWSLNGLITEYENIEEASAVLAPMYIEMADLLGITEPRIRQVPTLEEPRANRTRTSTYFPSEHKIVCAVGGLHIRKLIHEMCHGLNKQIIKGKRRNIGASHGYSYMAIYMAALAIYMFDGDFEHIKMVARAHLCKWDTDKLDAIIKAYRNEPQQPKEVTYTQLSLF